MPDDNGRHYGLEYKVTFINPSHQQLRTEEKNKYQYNQNRAQKIFKRQIIYGNAGLLRPDEGVIGNSEVIEQRHHSIEEPKNQKR